MTTVTVTFGSSERQDDDITGSWIQDQIKSRERDGLAVCATLRVQGDGIDVRLPVGDCGSSGAGGRAPNLRERAVLEIFSRLRLDSWDRSPGSLIAFARQASRL